MSSSDVNKVANYDDNEKLQPVATLPTTQDRDGRTNKNKGDSDLTVFYS